MSASKEQLDAIAAVLTKSSAPAASAPVFGAGKPDAEIGLALMRAVGVHAPSLAKTDETTTDAPTATDDATKSKLVFDASVSAEERAAIEERFAKRQAERDFIAQTKFIGKGVAHVKAQLDALAAQVPAMKPKKKDKGKKRKNK